MESYDSYECPIVATFKRLLFEVLKEEDV